MTAEAGDEGWVERYRRAGYRRFYENGQHPHYSQHVTIAYGEPDQEAPWLAAGRVTSPRIRNECGNIFMDFSIDSGGMTHAIDFNVNVFEVLWKGL